MRIFNNNSLFFINEPSFQVFTSLYHSSNIVTVTSHEIVHHKRRFFRKQVIIVLRPITPNSVEHNQMRRQHMNHHPHKLKSTYTSINRSNYNLIIHNVNKYTVKLQLVDNHTKKLVLLIGAKSQQTVNQFLRS